MVPNQHVSELIPAYALDCLDEDEAVVVTQHLAKCEVCQAELHAYQAIADQLPLAVPSVEPAARVKDGLMERIQSRQRELARSEPRISVKEGWTRFFRGLSPAWGMVSLVLILALLTSNGLLWLRFNQLNAASQPVAMRTVNLQGTESAPGASGLIVISADGEYGTLVVDNLPVLGDNQQYQLWLIQDGQRTSGGVFSVSKDGYSSLWVSSPQPLSHYTSFGVTIEPAGGSPGPTGKKVLGG